MAAGGPFGPGPRRARRKRNPTDLDPAAAHCQIRCSTSKETRRLNTTCPVLTPAEKQFTEIQGRVEQAMMATIRAALRTASEQAAEELRAADLDEPPPDYEYFVSHAHQQLFLLLCGADPETFEGGDPETATFVIRNAQNIRDHYWATDRPATSEDAEG